MNEKSIQTTLIHSDYVAPGGFDAFPPGRITSTTRTANWDAG